MECIFCNNFYNQSDRILCTPIALKMLRVYNETSVAGRYMQQVNFKKRIPN